MDEQVEEFSGSRLDYRLACLYCNAMKALISWDLTEINL